jgi:alpha-1,6-mannosyltransferase
VGIASVAVFFAGLVLPTSIVEYPRAIPVDTPLNHFYPGTSWQTSVLAILGSLGLIFLIALSISGGLSSAAALRVVIAVTLILALLSILAYPTGSRDIFKNISDTRTLWVHHANPLTTPPSRYPNDPLLSSLTQARLQRSPAYYGALYYVIAGPAALLAGGSVFGNLLAFKTLHALFLLGGVWLAGKAASRLAPGRELQAMILLGWNPLILYEGVVNAHNDLLMGLFVLLACYFGARSGYASFLSWALSAGIKYATGLIGPVFVVWHWRHSDRRKTLIAGAFTSLALLLVMLARHATITNLGIFLKFPAVNTPYSVLLQVLQPRLGYERASDLAQYTCMGLLCFSLGLIALLTAKSPRSLFGVCFWALVAIASFGVSYLWPWYFLWFIPLGAALAGRIEFHLAAVVSVTGILSYAIYPYRATGPELNYWMVALLFALPALTVLLNPRLWRPAKKGRSDLPGSD